MRPRLTRIVPAEWVKLGRECEAARDDYEELLGRYRQMAIDLSGEVYLASLAQFSPFSYATLRSWVGAAQTREDVPDGQEAIPGL